MNASLRSFLAMGVLLLAASCANILGLQEAGEPGPSSADAGANAAGAIDAAAGGLNAAAGEGGTGASSVDSGRGGESGAGETAGGAGDVSGLVAKPMHGLLGLSISSGVLEPAFDAAELGPYQVRVGVGVPALSVTPQAANPAAVILIQNKPVAAGTASDPIALALEQETSIEVVDDSTPAKTYTIKVERVTGLSNEAYLKASNLHPDDRFGASVALSQGTLAVGAPFEDGSGFGVDYDQGPSDSDNSGAVYVFVNSAQGWTQQAYLKASNPSKFDGFGSAVALAGDVLVVGAPGESSGAQGVDGEMHCTASSRPPLASGSGAAYVFHRVAGHWAQRAYLKASDSSSASLFGTSVAVSGSTIVVGSPHHPQPTELDSAGAAYVFDRLGETWLASKALAASNAGARDQFGASVAIDGGRIVVGAPGESSIEGGLGGDASNDRAESAGAAYVFDRGKDGWKESIYLKASIARAAALFGTSVAVDGALVAVGAPGESSSDVGVGANPTYIDAPNSGAVYVFANQGRPTSWEQVAYVKASNAELGDAFGSAVALGQGVLAVAASGAYYGSNPTLYGEDSSAVGINGDQKNELAEQSGAVYLFSQAGKQWEQEAYVKASNTDEHAQFGSSVAVADGDLAVGAELEKSSKADDPTDKNAVGSGAAYVRSLLPPPPAAGAGAPGLTMLEVSGASFDFSPTTFDYQLDVVSDSSVTLTAVAADPGAEITLTDLAGHVVDATKAIALDPGDNRFVLHVLSTSGDYVSYSADLRRPVVVTEVVADPPPFDVSAGMLWEDLSDSSVPVAIAGDTLVVGVPYDDIAADGSSDEGTTRDTGAVYVFLRTTNGWKKQAYLKASNAAANNYFGVAVALSGDTLVVGASGEASLTQQVNGDQTQNAIGGTQTGAAYVFVRSGVVWQQQAYLKASTASAYNYFGETVAIDGDRIVVGAYGENSQAFGVDDEPVLAGAPASGAAYIFHRAGGNWSQEAYLKATNTREDQYFGTRVAILGGTIAVSAPKEGGGSSSIGGDQNLLADNGGGAVYTYVLSGKDWVTEAYIKPPNYHIDLDFGRSLALGTDTLVVGATGDQSRARYVDGDEFDAKGGNWVSYNLDTSLSGNGAAYVFERAAGAWHQSAYLKASNSGGQDAFGRSVSLSGDYLAIGAPGESSSAHDMPDDDTAQSSGAAYLFHRSSLGWSQTSYVKPSAPTAGVGFGCFVGLDAGSLAVGNCRQQSPNPFDPKSFGKAEVFQF